MKILIGTPVHEVKDYAMEKWLENLSKIEYPADILIVDNSPNTQYIKKVNNYCNKFRIQNYTLKHIELPPEQKVFERVARCREVIREEVLANGYDAWFSWECDQIIPRNTLNELVRIMKATGTDIVELNSWGRGAHIPNCDWGVALINRNSLERYRFIPKPGTSFEEPAIWDSGEARFRQHVIKGGGSVIDVYGIVKPIYHLDK